MFKLYTDCIHMFCKILTINIFSTSLNNANQFETGTRCVSYEV
jgi:hypothetical protein